MKFKDTNSEGSGTKDYLKLKNGESITGIFMGEPLDFRQHWQNKKPSICLGSNCPGCKENLKSSFRFRINLVIKENEVYTPKIFEQGKTVYETLKSIHESGYNLEKHLMKITRHGVDMETTYTIMPVANGAIGKVLETKLLDVKLLDLGLEPNNALNAPEDDTPTHDDSDVPF